MKAENVDRSMAGTGAAVHAMARSPLVAVVLYLAIAGGLLATTGLAIASIIDHQRALAQTASLLDQLQGRQGRGAAAAVSARTGSPFLEGPTVTVAGAALLQRVAAAVGSVGGTIQSSQVDVLGTEAKDGVVNLVVSCELEQSALQTLLYDLEAGMPFLFVDQLDVQVPQSTASNEGGAGRIRVMLGISGQWLGNR